MKFQCSHEACFRDTTCALGHIKRQSCEHWSQVDPPENSNTADQELIDNSDIPWNGYSLGMGDLAILAGRGCPRVIGIVGPSDSGKTSLLTFVYLWLLKHGRIGEWEFAGSWTLGGWESIVQYSRWTGSPPPSFPPHTSSEGRYPGLLHLLMRCRKTGNLRDVMFVDAPGEWFVQWARVPNDATAEGARWVIRHSDVLLLMVDSHALADSAKLPEARRSIRDLIDRVAANVTYPVSVVWTKSDIPIPVTVEKNIADAIDQVLPNAHTVRTTTTTATSIEACFAWSIDAADSSQSLPFLAETKMSSDPFLSFRSEH